MTGETVRVYMHQSDPMVLPRMITGQLVSSGTAKVVVNTAANGAVVGVDIPWSNIDYIIHDAPALEDHGFPVGNPSTGDTSIEQGNPPAAGAAADTVKVDHIVIGNGPAAITPGVADAITRRERTRTRGGTH